MGDQILLQFAPPGNLTDLGITHKGFWGLTTISPWMNEEIAGVPGRTPLTQFFNGTRTPFDHNQPGATITWVAFPNNITVTHQDREARWRAADASRDVQDEYLEWSVLRNSEGNIIRVVFTCEGPEYWDFLVSRQQADGIRLIRELNAPLLDEEKDNTFFTVDEAEPENRALWRYIHRGPFNDLTTTGTVTHLVQTHNTLRAAVGIAAHATVIRKDTAGNTVTDSQQLIRCSRYGDALRNSDPRIGNEINTLARAGHKVSIADPVGVYIHRFDTSSFDLDAGPTVPHIPIPKGTFDFQRGNIDVHQGLRLKIQIPDGVVDAAGKQLTVSDIWDSNQRTHINFGSQFADYIFMNVRGIIANGTAAAPISCMPSAGVKSGASFEAMLPYLQDKIHKEESAKVR